MLHSYSPAVFLGISVAKPRGESFLDFMGTVTCLFLPLPMLSLCPACQLFTYRLLQLMGYAASAFRIFPFQLSGLFVLIPPVVCKALVRDVSLRCQH